MTTDIAILNSMADKDFDACLAFHERHGLHWLDLRDSIYGRTAVELDVETAHRAKDKIDAAGLEVYCLSTSIMFDDIAKGADQFEHHFAQLTAVIEPARVLSPRFFRLIAAVAPGQPRRPLADVAAANPWLVEAYRRAIDLLHANGFIVTIENEAPDCIITTAEDALRFFQLLDCDGAAGFTWDIQNQWRCGPFPSLETYEKLKPIIQYVHVKGGRHIDEATRALKWNVALEDASWPVAEIVRQVVADGTSPVICINMPVHGSPLPGYDYDNVVVRDIAFMRQLIGGAR